MFSSLHLYKLQTITIRSALQSKHIIMLTHREIENRTWAEFLLTYSLPAIIQDSLASHKVDSFKGIKGGKKKKKLVFT